jgi:hypothetical protein
VTKLDGAVVFDLALLYNILLAQWHKCYLHVHRLHFPALIACSKDADRACVPDMLRRRRWRQWASASGRDSALVSAGPDKPCRDTRVHQLGDHSMSGVQICMFADQARVAVSPMCACNAEEMAFAQIHAAVPPVQTLASSRTCHGARSLCLLLLAWGCHRWASAASCTSTTPATTSTSSPPSPNSRCARQSCFASIGAYLMCTARDASSVSVCTTYMYINYVHLS